VLTWYFMVSIKNKKKWMEVGYRVLFVIFSILQGAFRIILYYK
jgi:hypothetical protein